ncbi:TIGR04168 family protein [Romeria aff. gracilis LEGE 07310]|uniref:TIGR04168 family protein n=1 Tax=Vasconcelosia minhoensis LEGE 07310 TaxID=915328 RepID=A0A8J7AXI1_9CYAN|nr:TIGR04168 family protein [Romeria gracilis]MBE9079323.1 TIGR04168 family protein [Romeria aff. gracilis LEGE 07310]
MSKQTEMTIAVVGDVHDLWEAEDAAALRHLKADLVLFLGDYGNESVEIVRQIAAVDLPKAAVLGNHDAHYSASSKGQQKCPYDRAREDRVQQQLDLLGADHVGYGRREFPHLGLSVVGARPFSWGGSSWRYRQFYRDRFGVKSFQESTAKMMAAVKSAEQETLIFMGHVGPYGLGSQPEDPCGKDWEPMGGDCGDPDFADAIVQSRQVGKHIPLVAFGHMHHRLRHTQDYPRKRVVVDAAGTVYLNAANVPRIVDTGTDRLRSFSLVTLAAGQVKTISLVWLNQAFETVSTELLYANQSSLK